MGSHDPHPQPHSLTGTDSTRHTPTFESAAPTFHYHHGSVIVNVVMDAK
jgi:hypothetical protein